MPGPIYIVPVLSDNYCYWVVCPKTKKSAVIDCPNAKPALDVLQKNDWDFCAILNTHHHWDHVGGNETLLRHKKVPILGPALQEGERISVGALEAAVLKVPGHTLDHVAFYFPDLKAVFCGDALFVGGCGRLFEGTPEQMFESLGKLKALPDDTQIYCGHEYTQKNLEFALTVEPANRALQKKYEEVKQKRASGLPTVPSTIGEEKSYNPFIRSGNPQELLRRRRAKNSY
ncbi:MAG: hydroxyacylglutathione hydrolase [Deltaproteobacteria bacterium]|nr:hydroxyacylglutathione hydrolase [Deltaproteobacteria bacterium]